MTQSLTWNTELNDSYMAQFHGSAYRVILRLQPIDLCALQGSVSAWLGPALNNCDQLPENESKDCIFEN